IESKKTSEIVNSHVPEYKLVGEAFDCYIIVELGGELLLIDKHAAHERIIFEDLNSSRKSNKRISSQTLMLPLTILLSPDEVAAVNDYQDEIRRFGFEFNIGDKSVDLLAVPGAIDLNDAEALFIKMTDDLVLGKGNPEINEDIRGEKALYQIACKAAIKGGRMYNSAVTKWIVEKVLTLPDITVCPHGRPVAYKLTKREIDRQFERIK
ncbi:MAG: hypothetical protein IKY62_05260, partial [Clostridia bacterium]|nr:hypothetical protein [Clostridia bacterium]